MWEITKEDLEKKCEEQDHISNPRTRSKQETDIRNTGNDRTQ